MSENKRELGKMWEQERVAMRLIMEGGGEASSESTLHFRKH